jgi:hypothetical protein
MAYALPYKYDRTDYAGSRRTDYRTHTARADFGIVNNYWQSCCVGAAAQLELADLLANGPYTSMFWPSARRLMRPASIAC